MTRHGTYKIRNSQPRSSSLALGPEDALAENAKGFEPLLGGAMRSQRIVDSLRHQICQAHDGHSLRVRQIFSSPREIYRVEYEIPALSFQRIILLDSDALEELLEEDAVRELLLQDLGDAIEDGQKADSDQVA